MSYLKETAITSILTSIIITAAAISSTEASPFTDNTLLFAEGGFIPNTMAYGEVGVGYSFSNQLEVGVGVHHMNNFQRASVDLDFFHEDNTGLNEEGDQLVFSGLDDIINTNNAMAYAAYNYPLSGNIVLRPTIKAIDGIDAISGSAALMYMLNKSIHLGGAYTKISAGNDDFDMSGGQLFIRAVY